MSNKQKILNGLKNKSFVKIISGIQNYDKQKSLNVAMAAEMGGASALDICDDPEIIKPLRALVQLPLFVSSIDPLKLIAAQSYGVDVLEIGNYESFYSQGKMFTPKEILEIAQFVKKSVTLDLLLCCTVPATLEIENQIKLAKELINLGIDIIQTEGFTPDTAVSDRKDTSYNEILKAASTLANTLELRKALPNANIITASGITLTTAPLALAMGTNGVGIGSYINTLTTQEEMTEKVKEIMESVTKLSTQSLQETKTLALKH
ncbi:MAG: DUF561 domain-containing protein [Candidatus Melainabacteria bacterium]|nr:DUF561 domain-containing protein [Candidatus Melainabacteria bacterium]